MAGFEKNYTVARCIYAGELITMINDNFTDEEKERMSRKILKLTILYDDGFQELKSDKTLDSQGVTDGVTINLIVADPNVYIAEYPITKTTRIFKAMDHQLNVRKTAQNSDKVELDICVDHPNSGQYCVKAIFNASIGDWILKTKEGKQYIMWDQTNQRMSLHTMQAQSMIE